MQNDLKNIIESLLFVTDNPIDVRTFKQMMPEADIREIRQALVDLAAEYDTRQGGFLLLEVAGGFQFRTRPDYKDWIKKLVKPAPVRLSKAALETLAIIAYHQPIIRADVERIRGVDSGAIIRSLLERKLIRILGKKEIPGRPLIYATTRRFLELFNLKSLSDLPTLKEIQAFGKSGTAEDLAAELTAQQEQSENDDLPPATDAEAPTTDDDVKAAPPPEAADTQTGDSGHQTVAADSPEPATDDDPAVDIVAPPMPDDADDRPASSDDSPDVPTTDPPPAEEDEASFTDDEADKNF